MVGFAGSPSTTFSIDKATYIYDTLNPKAGLNPLRCTELPPGVKSDKCFHNPKTGRDECDSDEVGKDTDYPVFHYFFDNKADSKQNTTHNYRCVIDGLNPEDQARETDSECPLQKTKAQCMAFEYHGHKLCDWSDVDPKSKSVGEKIKQTAGALASNVKKLFGFGTKPPPQIYKFPTDTIRCRSRCAVQDFMECDEHVCSLTPDYKCVPRRDLGAGLLLEKSRTVKNSATFGPGNHSGGTEMVVKHPSYREQGNDLGFQFNYLSSGNKVCPVLRKNEKLFQQGEKVYIRAGSANSSGSSFFDFGSFLHYKKPERGKVVKSEYDHGDKMVSVQIDDPTSAEPKLKRVKVEDLLHFDEAKVKYRQFNSAVKHSSLFTDPTLWSCSNLGNGNKPVKYTNFQDFLKNRTKWDQQFSHPEIEMREPFTWLRVQVVNVDDPTDIKWNAVYTYRKPTRRVSSTAQPNVGATAHFYDADFYKYPYLNTTKDLFNSGINDSRIRRSLGQLANGIKSLIPRMSPSEKSQELYNPAISNGDLRRKWSYRVGKAMNVLTGKEDKETANMRIPPPNHILPHQRVIDFQPLCGPSKPGKRRLYDVSIVTDGMAKGGNSSPFFDLSMKKLYDFARDSLYLDMTEPAGGIKGRMALTGAEEIRKQAMKDSSSTGSTLLIPQKAQELLYKDFNPKKYTKKPIFKMLEREMINVPSRLRRKLAEQNFLQQESPVQVNYPVFPLESGFTNGNSHGFLNNPGVLAPGGEPTFYGDHTGIEVITPKFKSGPQLLVDEEMTLKECQKETPPVVTGTVVEGGVGQQQKNNQNAPPAPIPETEQTGVAGVE
ncbi:unnamed protein product [Amoebophrya sp. A120]|nr:unnamed protein product [Amoebophrya sp. A120]|eukprot:GSA120T00009536001.1